MTTRYCVFAGSSPGNRPAYAETARTLGTELAARGIGLVFGGGHVGLMGTLADAVLAGGGHVTGVTPRGLVEHERAHPGITELRVVESMHERKALMASLSDGFIALPGGLGTFEELLEVLTWLQLGAHDKPCGVVNVEGYWEPLLGLLDSAIAEGFVKPGHRALLQVGTDPAGLLERFARWRAPPRKRWLESGRT